MHCILMICSEHNQNIVALSIFRVRLTNREKTHQFRYYILRGNHWPIHALRSSFIIYFKRGLDGLDDFAIAFLKAKYTSSIT